VRSQRGRPAGGPIGLAVKGDVFTVGSRRGAEEEPLPTFCTGSLPKLKRALSGCSGNPAPRLHVVLIGSFDELRPARLVHVSIHQAGSCPRVTGCIAASGHSITRGKREVDDTQAPADELGRSAKRPIAADPVLKRCEGGDSGT